MALITSIEVTVASRNVVEYMYLVNPKSIIKAYLVISSNLAIDHNCKNDEEVKQDESNFVCNEMALPIVGNKDDYSNHNKSLKFNCNLSLSDCFNYDMRHVALKNQIPFKSIVMFNNVYTSYNKNK